MESVSRMRPTVQRLIGLPRSAEARWARSASDRRLSGLSVRATSSQARAATIARSRGGKRGLSPPSGLVLQAEVVLSPAFAPEADGVGVESDGRAGLDVGEVG